MLLLFFFFIFDLVEFSRSNAFMIVVLIVLYETVLRYVDKVRMYFSKDNLCLEVQNSQFKIEMGHTLLVVKYINNLIYSLSSGYVLVFDLDAVIDS